MRIAIIAIGVLLCLPLTLKVGFANDSHSFNGVLGLNTVPNARMASVGTTHSTISVQKPYTHASIGTQISDHLYMGIRQTIANKNDTHLFPGMDIKYRLYTERKFRPEIAVGLQSAFGHKRMAAEYLALSKRYHDFDFTLGIGWGRMATRGNFTNPLLLKSFGGRNRSLDGESPNSPTDWFTGDAALFGGVHYDFPWADGFSFNADWNGDGWDAEQAAYDNFSAPAPWSVGLSYHPLSWLDTGIAMQGTSSVMARLSLTPDLKNWGGRHSDYTPQIHLRGNRPQDTPYNSSQSVALSDRLKISHINIDGFHAKADLDISDHSPSAFQIGESARHLANIAGNSPEQISFNLMRYGLKGPHLTLNRRDLERLYLAHQGSVEEIWQTAEIESYIPLPVQEMQDAFKQRFGFKVDWVTDLSLAEEDAGILYRTAIIPSLTKHLSPHLLTETSVRFTLSHNLDRLADYRGISLFPVRADIDQFAHNHILLERQYLAGFVTLANDLHAAGSIGYLEEMYAGMTGEILYRPFEKPWAIGIELNQAMKRDPQSFMALGPNGDRILSGFINGYYEIPNTGATIHASGGRYLAGDVGASLSLKNEFDNGVIAEGFVTATNYSDDDIYGGKTNSYAGMSLSLPLGSLPFIPDGSRKIFHTRPLGRNTAQRLDNPVPLYDVTNPFSYRSITRHWSALTDAP